MKKRMIAAMLSAVLTAGLIAGCGSAASAPKDAEALSAAEGSTEAAEAVSDWTSEITFKASAEHPAAPDWTEYTALIQEIYNETDLEVREAKMHQAEDMLMATGAVVPLYYYNDTFLKPEGIEGDYASLFGTKYFMYTTKDGQPMEEFHINMSSEPDHLDPQLNTTVDGAALAANSFVGLYTYDPQDPSQIIAALADGEPEISEDALTYTVHMKKDLKWSDGSTLNANDFVYSWLRAANPATAADYSYLFDIFAKNEDGTIQVEATDDDTLVFSLNAPCPYIMDLMCFPVFMPVPQAAIEAADPDGTNPGAWTMEAGFVSNGAYTCEEWNHSSSMTYVKNPNYYNADAVTVDQLDFMLSADSSAILAAYQSGDIQYADSIPVGEIPTWKEKPDFHTIANLGTYYVGFNVNSTMFDGKTVEQANAMRRGLGMLIDRQYIVDTIAQTNQEVANTFVPGDQSNGHGGKFRENTDAYTYPVADEKGYYSLSVDTEKAIALLTQAGYKFDENGMLSEETPLTIEYLTNEGTGNEGIAQAIQQDLAMVGITVNITVEDWQTFLNDRKVGNFDVAREGWLCDYDDPINMLEMFLPTSGNNDSQLGK